MSPVGSISKRKCDGHQPTKVLDLGGGVYAGSKNESRGSFNKFPLVLNCSGTEITLPKHKIPFDWGKTFEKPEFKEISLDWDNNQAVLIDPDFWLALRNFIVDTNSKLLVCCFGGHGRTGTALVALMLAGGTWTTWAAINEIRKIYCDDAVETKIQVQYLEDLEKYFKEKA